MTLTPPSPIVFFVSSEIVSTAIFDVIEEHQKELMREMRDKCPTPPPGYYWHIDAKSKRGKDMHTIRVDATLRSLDPTQPPMIGFNCGGQQVWSDTGRSVNEPRND